MILTSNHREVLDELAAFFFRPWQVYCVLMRLEEGIHKTCEGLGIYVRKAVSVFEYDRSGSSCVYAVDVLLQSSSPTRRTRPMTYCRLSSHGYSRRYARTPNLKGVVCFEFSLWALHSTSTIQHEARPQQEQLLMDTMKIKSGLYLKSKFVSRAENGSVCEGTS